MPFLRGQPALLTRFRNGDVDAMADVYWAYLPRIEALARRFMKPFEVPDVVQEVFARGFPERNRHAYDGNRDYGPYLMTIARNLIVDRVRSAGRELSIDTMSLVDFPAEEEVVPWTDPRTMGVVEAYINDLPAPLREVHDARYVRGLPQREAATMIGISRQQLRTRESQLRDGLTAMLRKWEVL